MGRGRTRTAPNSAVIPLFITAMLAGRQPLVYGDGRQSRDFCYVGNVVQAILLAADADAASGRVLNVANGRSVDLLVLIDALNRLLGTRMSPATSRRGSATSARAWPTSPWRERCWATSRRSISKRACGGRIDYYRAIARSGGQ